jgi:hypothetical protein
MKRKIIVLVMVLVFIPSLLLAASTKYTKTEKVTYNPGKLTFDGVNINGSIKIGNATYINVSELCASLNKNLVKYSNGNITISNKKRVNGFLNSKWGDTPESVINKYGKPDTEDVSMISYLNNFQYGKDCATGFYFEDRKLTKAFHSFITTYDDCLTEYEDLVKTLYNEFDYIVFKDAYLPSNCPTNLDWSDAIKGYGAYMYTKLTNNTDTALITLKYNPSYGYFNITIDYESK